MTKLMLNYPCSKCGEWAVDYYSDGSGSCRACGASFPCFTFPDNPYLLAQLEAQGKIHRGAFCYHYGSEETCDLCNPFVRALHERLKRQRE